MLESGQASFDTLHQQQQCTLGGAPWNLSCPQATALFVMLLATKLRQSAGRKLSEHLGRGDVVL